MTYLETINTFKQAATSHVAINSFATGPIDWLDNPQNIEFPLMFVRPMSSPGYRTTVNGIGAQHILNFEVYFLDVPSLVDGDENTKILSDCEQYVLDIMSYFNFGPVQQDYIITLSSLTPVWEAFNDRATGWVASIQIQSASPLDYCNFPV